MSWGGGGGRRRLGWGGGRSGLRGGRTRAALSVDDLRGPCDHRHGRDSSSEGRRLNNRNSHRDLNTNSRCDRRAWRRRWRIESRKVGDARG